MQQINCGWKACSFNENGVCQYEGTITLLNFQPRFGQDTLMCNCFTAESGEIIKES